MIVIGWQIVMIVSAGLSLGTSGWPLIAAQAALAGYALFAVTAARDLPVWFVPLIMAGLGVGGYLASGDIDSVLVFAACWQINFATCAAGLLILSRWIIPTVVVVSATISTLVLLLLPGWGDQFPVTITVTQTAIIVALRLAVPALFSLATRADEEEVSAENARYRVEVARRVGAEIAEQSRVLHDTAVNTLGAIASGGAATADREQVREQCRLNVAALDALRGERTWAAGHDMRLPEVFALPGLPIRRHGLSDDAIESLSHDLAHTTVMGMARAASEAVLNANKHSRASVIDITVSADDGRLVVEIRDDGIGFDGALPPGRGLASSVFDRGRDLGFDAALRTATGEGTTITLRSTTQSAGGTPTTSALPHKDVDEIVSALSRRAGMVWSAGATVVTIILTVAGGTNHDLVLFPMIATMAAVWLAFTNIPPRTLRWWEVLGLTASTVLVFGLSAAATSFGIDGAVHWQALAATGPFILLLSSHPSRRTVAVAGSAWAAAVVGISALVWPYSITGAAIVLVAGCVGGMFSYGWAGFLRNVATLSADTASAQRRTLEARRAADAERAAQEAYRRWVDAGIDSAAALLRAIAHGRRDPQDPATREACSIEEAYLRQLVLVSPELVHLGRAIMPTLKHARERGVPLRLLLGGQDTADDAQARSLAAVVLRALEKANPGQPLTASVFPVQDGLQLTLVGSIRETGEGGRTATAHPTDADGGAIRQIMFRSQSGSSIDHDRAAPLQEIRNSS